MSYGESTGIIEMTQESKTRKKICFLGLVLFGFGIVAASRDINDISFPEMLKPLGGLFTIVCGSFYISNAFFGDGKENKDVN